MDDLRQQPDEYLAAQTPTDQRCFAVLIERYQEKLLRYVRRISSFSNEEAEDILQEVFIKAYTNIREFDTSLTFSSWIYRIAHNHTISAFRKHKSRPQGNAIDVDPEVIERISAEWHVAEEADHALLQEYMARILQQLEPKYRAVLELKYLEYKSYAEISDILKRPEGTIATLLHRAKKKCLALMEKEREQALEQQQAQPEETQSAEL